MGNPLSISLALLSVLLSPPCLDAAEEVCISDTFNASCSAGEVVFIESAFYGRMRNKRCFNLTENESNCSTDVRQPLEARFGLRQNILLKLSSPFFTERVPTCLKGRMPLLEIAHQCAKCIGNEVCIQETFNATCPNGTVIQIKSALYGRMRSSRCIDFGKGNGSCYANVQPYLERLCNGRTGCSIKASNDTLKLSKSSCLKHLKPYLEVFYSCTPAAEIRETDDLIYLFTSTPTDDTPSVDDPSVPTKTAIIVPCVMVALTVLLATLSVLIHKRRPITQQRTNSCYVDIDEPQPDASSRYEQNISRIDPKSSQGDVPTPAPLYESVPSSSNQHRILPTDSHIYTELLNDDEPESQPISDAVNIDLPVNLRNINVTVNITIDKEKVQL